MLPQLLFFTSVAFSFLAWGIVCARYLWPALRRLDRADALRPLLILHSFRFIGLAFLIPGVASPDLPSVFAQSAAYGDLVTAALAVLALVLLPGRAGIVATWAFSVWGSVDLLRAFYLGNLNALVPGQLGAAYFIPTVLVPLMLITHGLVFRILLRHSGQAGARLEQEPAHRFRRCRPGNCPAAARSSARPQDLVDQGLGSAQRFKRPANQSATKAVRSAAWL